ncbi:hypothetical protein [Mucilaginibacter sp.]|uniref:hypothetical protein n=1 Tax=Mucilaginibacter sp. TaxID=1882438 RepID=UPI00261D48F9|nr:hypothetical protein [Mucilaginibacter sp.]MDB4926547.1 hypothetical protein [Mucilaginibacter sp.]
MINEIDYEYKNESGVKSLNLMLKAKDLAKIKLYLIFGVTAIVLTIVVVYFSLKHLIILSMLTILLPFWYFVMKAEKLHNEALKKLLRDKLAESFTIKLSIEKFNKLSLKKILEKKGITSLESVLLLQAQLDKVKQDSKKELKTFNIVSLSIIITLIIFYFNLLTKDVKLNDREINEIAIFLILIVILSLITRKIFTGWYDLFYRGRYYRLKEISELLGDIAIDKNIAIK